MSGFKGDRALARATTALRSHEATRGGHSWGYAYLADGELTIEHGIGHLPTALDVPETDVAIAHTRFATRGDITLENAHPFAVRDLNGEVLAAIAHNGTWLDAPDDGRVDSWHIARVLETALHLGYDMTEAVAFTGEYVGETILVLDAEGAIHTYHGRYDITETDSGFRSTGGRPIPKHEVHTVA